MDYTTIDGTATAGNDYINQSDSLIFNPGETTQTIEITINEDGLDEINETFFINGNLNSLSCFPSIED